MINVRQTLARVALLALLLPVNEVTAQHYLFAPGPGTAVKKVSRETGTALRRARLQSAPRPRPAVDRVRSAAHFQAEAEPVPTPALPEEIALPPAGMAGEVWGEPMLDESFGGTLAADMPVGDACGAPCGPFIPDGWVHGEYLMWWPRPMRAPPLVTRGTQASEAVLGETGTETLLGGDLLDRLHSGARLRLGIWGDACHETAWIAEGFIIGELSETHTYSGSGAAGTAVLGRPFFNVLSTTETPNGREDVELISYPGQVRGTVAVSATSQLYGASVHAMRTLYRCCDCGPAPCSCACLPGQRDLSGFIGWRYLNLDEELRINEDLTSLLPAPENGRFLIDDRFQTDNTFNGADIGVLWKANRGPYSLDLLARLALGSTRQRVSIAGSTTLTGSGGGSNDFRDATGGLYAQRTNIGEYSRNQFAVVPELGVTCGWAITPRWRATVGYTFLYWSSVVRPGDQIDRDVNPNLFPPEETPLTGLERPVFSFVESDLWINGLNIGLERVW